MERKKVEYASVDIAKFIMAILVVAIHVEPFTGEVAFLYNHCIARIADPLFFIITAYFMFDKTFQNEFSWICLGKYMMRISKLYFGWIIIYSPVILLRTWNESLNIEVFVGSLFRKVFLSGPYGAMWFLTALLLAIPLTFFVTKYIGPRECVIISAPFFLITVLHMEYNSWMIENVRFQTIIDSFERIFGWLANGINYGFFFCSLGMYIAYLKRNGKEPSFLKSVVCAVLSFLALILECYFIRTMQIGISYGAMFFLIPTSYFICHCLLHIKLQSVPGGIWLRRSSILIFTIHYGVMEALQYYANNRGYFVWNTTWLYILVIIITLLISTIILKISQYKYFRWLKFLY